MRCKPLSVTIEQPSMKKNTFILIVLFFASCQNKEQPKEQTEIQIEQNSDTAKSITLQSTEEENESSCNCKNANLTFDFKNGAKIALCGEPDEENSYSEHILYDCKKDSTLEDLTGDGTVSYKINFKNDTLYVEELYGVPNGKNKEEQWLPFYTTKYYYDEEKLKKSSSYKKNLKKYSPKEIEEVLTDFKKTNDNGANMDAYLKAINQLFWAYYSGSIEAEKELDKLKSKYHTYDGGVSEEFDTYIATYLHYKKIK